MNTRLKLLTTLGTVAFIGIGIVGTAYARDTIPLRSAGEDEFFAEPDDAPRRDHALLYGAPSNSMVTPSMTDQALSVSDPANDPHWGPAADATDDGV